MTFIGVCVNDNNIYVFILNNTTMGIMQNVVYACHLPVIHYMDHYCQNSTPP